MQGLHMFTGTWGMREIEKITELQMLGRDRGVQELGKLPCAPGCVCTPCAGAERCF